MQNDFACLLKQRHRARALIFDAFKFGSRLERRPGFVGGAFGFHHLRADKKSGHTDSGD
jgi:hypothetical protein